MRALTITKEILATVRSLLKTRSQNIIAQAGLTLLGSGDILLLASLVSETIDAQKANKPGA